MKSICDTKKIFTLKQSTIFALILIIFFFNISERIFSQDNPNYKVLTVKITRLDSAIKTGDRFLIQESDTLKIDGNILSRGDDYKIDYREGNIMLSKNIFSKYSLDTNRIYDAILIYDLFPYELKEEYSNFEIMTQRDTVTGDTINVASTNKDFVGNLFEGTDLEKSGSIFRSIDFGTNRDLTLNSGFRVQLKGKLSSEVEITAALTDEKTPIQPEGNTLKLQELDKVFIEIRSNNVAATLGDFDVNYRKSEFVNFSRKIQGAKGYGDFNFGELTILGAVSRGKFNTNKFNGTDGMQGPYKLVGVNNEVNLLVLSGTEKVYLDGRLLTRGEQADYTIDYALGQITFTNKVIIKNTSRISVDFEYSDRKYNRLLTGFDNQLKFFDNKLKVGISYVNETDNEDSPVDFTLSDSDKVILKNAGNDKLKATKTGVIYVGRDSLNKPLGTYVRLQDSTGYVYYKYLPGDTAAVYNITFTYVGSGNGDYINKSTFEYQYVGKGGGTYAPVIYLPMPTAYQMADIKMEYSLGKQKDLTINLESAYSVLNKNKFSDFPDVKDEGVALSGTLRYTKNKFKLFGIDFKSLDVSYHQRVINKLFNSLDRINSVEFNRDYDVQDSTQLTEDLKEGYLSVSPGELLNIKANISSLNRGDIFSSLRTIASAEFNNPSNLTDNINVPKFKYTFENVSSSYDPTNSKGSWLKNDALLSYNLPLKKDKRSPSFILFSMLYHGEIKKNSIGGNYGDSLLSESFRYNEFTPHVGINNIMNFNLYAELNYRVDDSPLKADFVNLSKDFTQKYGMEYNGSTWLYSLFDISLRDKKYSQYGTDLGNVENNTILINSRTRISPLRGAVNLDLLYNVTSERTAKIQRLFVLVPTGQGNYIYLGDLNNNGIQDENEFQLVNYDGNYIKVNLPTDELYPTIDLKSSARLNLKPSKYFYISSGGILASIYNNLSTETLIRIDEKSKDPTTSDIYLMRLSNFLNDSNTVLGTQYLQQDVNLFENNPLYSLRFRFTQQKGLSQYSSGNERAYLNTKDIKARLGFTRDLTLQLQYIRKTDRNIAPTASIRNRNISSNAFNTDIGYIPIKQIESGLEMNFITADDIYPDVPTNAKINQQIFRFIFSFATVGRVRFEAERYEVIFNTSTQSFPYELTNGHVEGKSYYIRVFFDYSFGKNLQASVSYDGRSEGQRRVMHLGKAQVTAFF